MKEQRPRAFQLGTGCGEWQRKEKERGTLNEDKKQEGGKGGTLVLKRRQGQERKITSRGMQASKAKRRGSADEASEMQGRNLEKRQYLKPQEKKAAQTSKSRNGPRRPLAWRIRVFSSAPSSYSNAVSQ